MTADETVARGESSFARQRVAFFRYSHQHFHPKLRSMLVFGHTKQVKHAKISDFHGYLFRAGSTSPQETSSCFLYFQPQKPLGSRPTEHINNTHTHPQLDLRPQTPSLHVLTFISHTASQPLLFSFLPTHIPGVGSSLAATRYVPRCTYLYIINTGLGHTAGTFLNKIRIFLFSIYGLL